MAFTQAMAQSRRAANRLELGAHVAGAHRRIADGLKPRSKGRTGKDDLAGKLSRGKP
jgi:hypothetical protein